MSPKIKGWVALLAVVAIITISCMQVFTSMSMMNGTQVLCNSTEHTQQAQRKRLEFVHIPKTGGTVIESIAADHNITWSICHFGYPDSIARISLNLTHCPPGSLKHMWPKEPKHNNCPWWHVPPQYFEWYDSKINPYAGADLFAVVRNPYDRVISHYYYSSKYISKKSETWINDLSNMNAYVNRKLTKLSSSMRRGDISRKIPGNNQYFGSSGHWIPQYDYVYENRRKVVQHVLRFENLKEDFSNLMDRYDLPLKLPEKQYRPSDTKKLGVYNLTRENLEQIEKVYWQDFVEFGYEVLS